MYKIHYLPLALDDLRDIVWYIAHTLESPQAAENFISKMDRAVLKIADNPFRCHLYTSPEKLKYAYRILQVDNYSLFYVVENKKIEIHRIIYSQRDIIRYIVHTLEAPQAAENFISKIDRAVLKIADNPFRCHLYTSPENLKYAYRVLQVDNYTLFYAVENEKIEIHRVIYSRRDIARILKAQEENEP
jgi:plasmid stabilization system protein ParE